MPNMKNISVNIIISSLCAVLLLVGACRKRPYRHLTDRLQSKNLQDKQTALRSLQKLGPKAESAIPEVAAALQDPGVMRLAANTLASFGPAAVSALRQALHSPTWQIREAAADALGEIGKPARSASPVLIKQLQAKQVFERQAAARALGKIGPNADALRGLSYLLKDEEPATRRIAAKAIAQAGPKAALYIPELLAALNNRDYRTRVAAAQALGRIGKKAIPFMTEQLKSDEASPRDVHMKMCIAQVLGTMGKIAEPAIPTLLLLLSYDSGHAAHMTVGGLASSHAVREAAADSILKLTTPQTPYKKQMLPILQKAQTSNESKQVQIIAIEILRKLGS